MKFLKFLFTARLSFVLFAFLAFAFTMLYLWAHGRQTSPRPPQQRYEQTR